MKRIFILLTSVCFALTGLAQTDTTAPAAKKADTIKIGNMVIIKRADGSTGSSEEVRINRRKSYKPSNISTNWLILDLGFANFNDQTNYAAAQASGFVDTKVGEDQFDLRGGLKSMNVNIWFFMQRLNVVKHVVNLKYGLGLELNNYRFQEDIKFQKNPTKVYLMGADSSYSKNKLAVDYLTVPFMINFNFTPRREDGFGISFGASAGYLYSARQKFKGGPGDKYKVHDDFDLRRWKISYIGEVQLGPVKLYGSYATESMFEKGLDQTPYNVGVRFSNW
jgi:hypothetical protein